MEGEVPIHQLPTLQVALEPLPVIIITTITILQSIEGLDLQVKSFFFGKKTIFF